MVGYDVCMSEGNSSTAGGTAQGPATPVETGSAGTQVVSTATGGPATSSFELQHTDLVASSMRGIGAVPGSSGEWQMGVANYEALALEYRQSKQDCRELTGRLDKARQDNADLRVLNERLDGKAPLGTLRTVTSNAFVTIGGLLIGLSFRDSVGDISLSLLVLGCVVLAFGWFVALWKTK